MRRYYYYVCSSGNSVWSKVCYSDNGEFDVALRLEFLHRTCRYATIISWKEISSTQYEKLSKYFDNQNK